MAQWHLSQWKRRVSKPRAPVLKGAKSAFDQLWDSAIPSPCREFLLSYFKWDFSESYTHVLPFRFRKLSQEEKAGIEKAFKQIDTDGNGTVCQSELKAVLQEMEGPTMSEDVFQKFFDFLDKDGDNKISLQELIESFEAC